MILVLGGTLEGREIAAAITGMGYPTLLTVVSGYGAGMVAKDPLLEVRVGSLDEPGLQALVRERGVRLIVDATHPYAGIITATAWQTARAMQVPFIRYDRPQAAAGADGAGIYQAKTYEDAADMARDLGATVFLTIGSKNLRPFIEAGRRYDRRIVARVLPDVKVLAECTSLGLRPMNIVAVQGPFSVEMNIAMLREYKADVLVTKDSGSTGGTDAKLEAAAQMGIPVVVVGRPDTPEGPVTDSIPEILAWISRMTEK